MAFVHLNIYGFDRLLRYGLSRSGTRKLCIRAKDVNNELKQNKFDNRRLGILYDGSCTFMTACKLWNATNCDEISCHADGHRIMKT